MKRLATAVMTMTVACAALSLALPVRADEHRDAGQNARQHQRLVAGVLDACENFRAVRYNGDTICLQAPRVAPCQDGRAFAVREQQARDVRHGRSFAAAARTKVANTDDRLRQMAPALRVARVPSPPPRGDHAVDGARC